MGQQKGMYLGTHGNFGNNTKNTSQNIWDEIREHI